MKSSLAFAGVTLFGAAILAATFATPQAEGLRNEGGYNDAEYTPPPESSAMATQDAMSGSFEADGAGEFSSDDQLVDDTSGFDPSADAMASGGSDDSGQAGDEGGSAETSDDTGEGAPPVEAFDS